MPEKIQCILAKRPVYGSKDAAHLRRAPASKFGLGADTGRLLQH